MILVNRMDRENANFESVLAMLRQRWGPKVAPLQIPIGAHDSFEGVVDLLHMKAYVGELGEEAPIPPELQEVVTNGIRLKCQPIKRTSSAVAQVPSRG